MHEVASSRNRWSFFVWVLATLVVLGAGLFFAMRGGDQSVHGIREQTYNQLEQVVIPEFKLQEATLDEAIAHLNRSVAEKGLSRELRFESWQSVEPPKGFMRSENEAVTSVVSDLETPSGSTLTGAHPSKEQMRHSISLENVPLSAALRYVSGLFECVTGERGKTVYLVHARGTFGPLLECTYRINPHFGTGLPSVGERIDCKPFLRMQGVEFYEGTDAYVLPGGKLVVRHVQDGIDLISAIVGAPPEPNVLTRIKWWIMGSWEQMRMHFSAP